MKKEMKIVLPFYKIAYAVSFLIVWQENTALITAESRLPPKPPTAI